MRAPACAARALVQLAKARGKLGSRPGVRESFANHVLRQVDVCVHQLHLPWIGSVLLHETIVSSLVKRSSRDAALDTRMKLVFHGSTDGPHDAPPAAGWRPAHAVEPSRARMAPASVARRRAAQ